MEGEERGERRKEEGKERRGKERRENIRRNPNERWWKLSGEMEMRSQQGEIQLTAHKSSNTMKRHKRRGDRKKMKLHWSYVMYVRYALYPSSL